MLTWQWSHFESLNVGDLYALLAARNAVFAVEQNCPYQDLDGFDQQAWHLLGWREAQHDLAAYCRVIAPGIKYAEPAIGRVLTPRQYRGAGLGRQLMTQALARTTALYPGQAIRIAAQQRLEKFYADFGFTIASGMYMEDGIAHVEMLRPAPIV